MPCYSPQTIFTSANASTITIAHVKSMINDHPVSFLFIFNLRRRGRGPRGQRFLDG
jgi:hypothetical protein